MGIVAGLTGSFGSGKSTVARMFEEMGVPVQDADRVAREAVEPGRPALEEIVRAFGPGILDAQGGLDRKKMAELAFADPAARKRLNAIVHPRVREEQARFLREKAAEPLVVLEIPLLLESGGRAAFAKVIVVAASERARFGRLRRAGFSEGEIIARLGAQMPQERKRELADWVVENDGDLAATREQVRKIARDLIPPRAPAAQAGADPIAPARIGANP